MPMDTRRSGSPSQEQAPWYLLGWCVAIGLAVALAFNIVQHQIFVRISPAYYRLNPFPGPRVLVVGFDALIEGVSAGLWQGVLIGAAAGFGVVLSRGRFPFSRALRAIGGVFSTSAGLQLFLGPALIKNGVLLGSISKTQGFDQLSDRAQTLLSTVNFLINMQVTIVLGAIALSGLIVLDSRVKRGTKRKGTEEMKPARYQSLADLPVGLRWYLLTLSGFCAPAVVAAVGIYFPTMPGWIGRVAFGFSIACTLVGGDGVFNIQLRGFCAGLKKLPKKRAEEEVIRGIPLPLSAKLLTLLVRTCGLSLVFAIGVGGLNSAASEILLGVGFALFVFKVVLAGITESRELRRRRGGDAP